MNILLLEDNTQEGTAIMQILVDNDNYVKWCKTPDDVNEFIKEELKDNPDLQPSLMIFDIELDGEESGIDVAEKQYRHLVGVPIIWITKNYVSVDYIETIKKKGLPSNNFLPKTLIENKEAFIQAVHNVVLNSTSSADWIKKGKRRLGFQVEDGGYQFIGKNDFVLATTVTEKDVKAKIYLSDGTSFTNSRGLEEVRRFLEKDFDNLLKLNKSYLINIEKIKAIRNEGKGRSYLFLSTAENLKDIKIDIDTEDITKLKRKGLIFLTRK
jgi:hypothetical protein